MKHSSYLFTFENYHKSIDTSASTITLSDKNREHSNMQDPAIIPQHFTSHNPYASSDKSVHTGFLLN
jgi:hypothetical protein